MEEVQDWAVVAEAAEPQALVAVGQENLVLNRAKKPLMRPKRWSGGERKGWRRQAT